MRAFKQLARFTPFIAGTDLSYADCAAGVHLPLVSLASKIVYGRDALEDCAPVKPYLKMLNERPGVQENERRPQSRHRGDGGGGGAKKG